MKPIALLFGALMLVSVMLVPLLTPDRITRTAHSPHLEVLVPEIIGTWRMDAIQTPMMPATDVQKQLNLSFEQLLQRTYVNDQGQRIMLVVGFSTNQLGTLKAHRQEVCYSAQGADIRDLHQSSLVTEQGTLPLTRMLAVTPTRMESVTYWLTLGERVVNSPLAWLFAQLQMGLRGELPHGLLVRVSTLSSDPAQAFRLHDRFIADLVGQLPVGERWRFIGSGGVDSWPAY